MTLEQVINRIELLESIRDTMNTDISEKKIELAVKEAEVVSLREHITQNLFINTEYAKELEELKITKKWLER